MRQIIPFPAELDYDLQFTTLNIDPKTYQAQMEINGKGYGFRINRIFYHNEIMKDDRVCKEAISMEYIKNNENAGWLFKIF